MIVQKHPGKAHCTRGFCRHGPVCFEDEKARRLRSLAPHKYGWASMTWLNSPLNGVIPAPMPRNRSFSKPKRRG
jgi:hypothetical protein